jgi:Raf kinase inhibitor-like YbhB/YbcL family protein
MEDRMVVKSKAFSDGGRIPAEYANRGIPGGKNISIPVEWEGIDSKNPEVKSYALTITDRSAHDWVHWIVLDIPVSVTGLEEGASGRSIPNGAREIMNTFGVKGYGGPQPPASSGDHVYEVTVYALNVSSVDLDGQPSYKEFLQTIKGKVVDQAKISGVLGR